MENQFLKDFFDQLDSFSSYKTSEVLNDAGAGAKTGGRNKYTSNQVCKLHSYFKQAAEQIYISHITSCFDYLASKDKQQKRIEMQMSS